MPYTKLSDLPDWLNKYPAKKRKQWMAVWNSVYGRTGSEERAFKAANAILKQEGDTMNGLIQARIDLLTGALTQVGKRLSTATITEIKGVIDSLTALVGDDDATEEAVDQAWAPVGEILSQMMVTGESTEDSYQGQVNAITDDLKGLSECQGQYPCVIYMWPDHVVFEVTVYAATGAWESTRYRADYQVDDQGNYTLSNVQECEIVQVCLAVQSALTVGDSLLQAKRADVSPADKARAAKKYGDVTYADPTNKKYPIDTEEHVRAAWSYINMPKNAAKYSAADLKTIKARIKAAAKKFGITISEQEAETPVGFIIEQGDGKPPFLLQQTPGQLTILQENVGGKGVVKFGGVATVADVVNTQGQVYVNDLWERQVEAAQDSIAKGRLVGATWHPRNADGTARDPEVHELSHRFTNLLMDGNKVKFEAETLLTDSGKNLAGVLTGGVGLDMSTRGVGTSTTGEWQGQTAEIIDPDGFELHGIDTVLRGASPGSAVEYARLQSVVPTGGTTAEPKKEDAMDPEEVRKLIQEAVAAGNENTVTQLQALEEKVKGLGPAQLSDEDKALLQGIKDEAGIKERDKKVNEVVDKMVADKELPDQFRSSAVTILQGMCTLAADVEAKLPQAKESLKPVLQFHQDALSKGMYVREYNDDGSKVGRVASVDEAIDELIQKKVEQKLLIDNGAQDFSNTARSMRIMLQTLHKEKPYLGFGYMKLRNREIKTLEQSKDWLLTSQAAKHFLQDIPTGAMTTDDVAASVPYVFPIVIDLYPQLLAMQLGTVQPLERSTGRIYFWHILNQSNQRMDQVAHFTGSYANDPGEKETIKKLKGQIVSEDVATEIKKLGYDLSVEVMRHLRTDFGIDATGTLVAACADEIAREWNYQILADMLAGASAGNVNYGALAPADASFDGEQWQKQIVNHAQRARDLIYNLTFADTVWIIGEAEQISRITWLSKQVGEYTGDGRGRVAEGIDIVGALTTGEVLVKVGWWNTLAPHKLLIAARGSTWPRTGYVIAPYLGLYATPIFVDPDTQDVKQSLQSELARKMVNGNYFATVTVQQAVHGTPL